MMFFFAYARYDHTSTPNRPGINAAGQIFFVATYSV